MIKNLHSLFVFVLLSVQAAAAEQATARAITYYHEDRTEVGWENDKIAFRMYGPKLNDGKHGNGHDCWLKRVSYPIVEKWYHQKASYHVDHGEGCDAYKVGFSVGCGGSALWIDGKPVVTGVFTSHKILENGPEKIAFEVSYAWEHAGKAYTELRRITLGMGERLFSVDSRFTVDGKVAADLPLAVGLAKQTKGAEVAQNPAKRWIAVWDKNIAGGDLGTGLQLAAGYSFEHQVVGKQALIVTRTDAEGRIRYSAGYGWAKAGEIIDFASWKALLEARP